MVLLPLRGGWGQNAGFTLSVDRTNITLNQQVQLEIELRNADRFPEVNLDLDAFKILGGPARSSSYQWVNGRAFSTKKLVYTLAPLRPGTHTIGPLLMQYQGRKYTSNSVTITVSGTAAGHGQQPSSGQQEPQQTPISDVVYIQAAADRTAAYPGEQITVEYKLYTRVSVRNYSIDDQASAIGFWKEEIETPENPQLRQEVINGIRYNTAIIKRMAYFPTKSGELTIEPLPVTVKVQASRSRSFFDDFFSDSFSRVVTKQLAGNAITIDVQPIPTEGRPLSFNGAVGEFGLSASLDTTAARVDEAVGMNITIKGSGNLPMVNIPAFDPPDGLDMFEPEIEKDIRFRNGILTGEVKYQYVFVPRLDGTMRIPSIPFSYFNPETKTFHTLETGERILTVSPVDRLARMVESGFSREEVRLLNQDIRYLKTDLGRLQPVDQVYYTSWGFYTIFLLGLGLIGGTLGYQYWYERWGKNVTYLRRKNAMKRANKYLKQAHQHKDASTYYSLLARAVLGFIGDKGNLRENALNTEEIMGYLQQQSVPDSTVQEINNFLNTCDAGRFSPNAHHQTQSNNLGGTARHLIKELDKYL